MSLKNVTKNVRLNEHEGESLPPGLNPQAVFDTPPSPRGSAPKTPFLSLRCHVIIIYFICNVIPAKAGI